MKECPHGQRGQDGGFNRREKENINPSNSSLSSNFNLAAAVDLWAVFG